MRVIDIPKEIKELTCEDEELRLETSPEIFDVCGNKKLFKLIMRTIKGLRVKTPDYDIYSWGDASGWEYWKNKKFPDLPYYIITVDFKRATINKKHIHHIEETIQRFKNKVNECFAKC